MKLSGHQLAEVRSLALHREIARRLLEDRNLLEAARQRVEEWCRTGGVHSHYAQAWRALLQLPPPEIAERLTDPGERGQELRQVTPFAGAVPPRERWRIWREAGDDEGQR